MGSVDDFEYGKFQVFSIKGRPIGVVRTKKGFYAVRNRCPHQGADVCKGWVTGTHVPSDPHIYEYTEDQMVIQCPWHRWEFDLENGRTVANISNKRLVTYDTVVDGDDVYVNPRARKEIPS